MSGIWQRILTRYRTQPNRFIMNFKDFHMGGLIKVTLFYINCLKKNFFNIFHFTY